ncbi:hypothetical protein AAC387_Pa04g1555 [Persea americana]
MLSLMAGGDVGKVIWTIAHLESPHTLNDKVWFPLVPPYKCPSSEKTAVSFVLALLAVWISPSLSLRFIKAHERRSGVALGESRVQRTFLWSGVICPRG